MPAGSADYNVFDAARGTSTTGSSFGFTGEWTDAETGYLFLRARYYSPGSVRFTSVDTVIPNAPGTAGYHGYAYAANNPTTWTDPSGHFALAGSASIQMIMAMMMATQALIIFQQVGALNQEGMLEPCQEDTICGNVVERVQRRMEGIFDNPNPTVQRLVEAIFNAIPLARFAVYWAFGVEVLTALYECVKSGRCLPRRDNEDGGKCAGFPENGPYLYFDA